MRSQGASSLSGSPGRWQAVANGVALPGDFLTNTRLTGASDEEVLLECVRRGLYLVQPRDTIKATYATPGTDSPPADPANFAACLSSATAAPTGQIWDVPFPAADAARVGLGAVLSVFDPWDDVSRDAAIDELTRLYSRYGSRFIEAVCELCFAASTAGDQVVLLADWLGLLDDRESRTRRGFFLVALLGDSSVQLRLAATAGLEWMGFAPAAGPLRDAADKEPVPFLRQAMEEAARAIGGQ